MFEAIFLLLSSFAVFVIVVAIRILCQKKCGKDWMTVAVILWTKVGLIYLAWLITFLAQFRPLVIPKDDV